MSLTSLGKKKYHKCDSCSEIISGETFEWHLLITKAKHEICLKCATREYGKKYVNITKKWLMEKGNFNQEEYLGILGDIPPNQVINNAKLIKPQRYMTYQQVINNIALFRISILVINILNKCIRNTIEHRFNVLKSIT